jgi:hypothetical protein
MRVAFIHYHLNPGGVTTVIRQQVEALRENGGDPLVLAGLPPPALFPADTVSISGLGYASGKKTGPTGDNVSEAIATAISKRWPDGCDMVHVHNPTLMKNTRFPAILAALQEKGFPLLLQVHDFAEDGRPDNYSPAPYPRDCHYAVINSRDYDILLNAGLQREGLHLLPNMVSPLDTAPGKPPETAFILYPVRGIRRKNIGEAILLSLFWGAGRHLAVTLPPNSPADMAAYRDWKQFSEEHRLPVRFEAGLRDDFAKLAAATDYFVTTSITEGFGFSFLEPWTAEKSLRGRKLPDICDDFEAKGMALDDMYTRLLVPTAWFDLNGYIDIWRKTVKRICHRFMHDIDSDVVMETETRFLRCSEIDFGLLNEKYQKQVLQHLLKNPAKKTVLKGLNPFLENLSSPPALKDHTRRNRDIVLAEYSADTYRNTLMNMYARVVKTPVFHGIRKDILLTRLLDFKRLSLLKWGVYER